MKIIFTGLTYCNYQKELGQSFEYTNFYKSLERMPGIEVLHFPYERILEVGRSRGNEELIHLVRNEKPDAFFAFMFTDELELQTLDEIKKLTKSIAWFSDDHWRFHNYSRYYAPHFSFAVTTYSRAIEWYKKISVSNIIHSQWAAAGFDVSNPVTWRTPEQEQPFVSFVGNWSRPRQKILTALARAGIHVAVYGNGWPRGRIDEKEMLWVFKSSKINLALNPPSGHWNTNSLGRIFFRRSMNKIVFDAHMVRNFTAWLHRGTPQIKARHFEIPACGGFLLTALADNIGDYYTIGDEIVAYQSLNDLIEKIKYYLSHDDERKKITKACYERTLRDHTYEKRFREIFKIIGL